MSYVCYLHVIILMVCFVIAGTPSYFFALPAKKQPIEPPKKIFVFATTIFCMSLLFCITGTILFFYNVSYRNEEYFPAIWVYAGVFFNLWVFPSGIRYFYKRLNITGKIVNVFRIKKGKKWEI